MNDGGSFHFIHVAMMPMGTLSILAGLGIGISMSGTELEVFGLFDSLLHLEGRVFFGAGTPHPARQVCRDHANQSAADRSLWLGSGPGLHETDLAHVPKYRWRPPVRIHCPKAVDLHSRPGMERLRLLQASSASHTFLVAAPTAKGEEGRWEFSGFIAIEIVVRTTFLIPPLISRAIPVELG